jgi:iron complex transport system substrate-binding protein
VRVVSHTCSNTEIVCALGCADFLVGVDDHSDYPAEVVRNLPRIGPDLSVDVGRVRKLNPDLVLTSLTVPGHERIVEDLAAAHLPLLVVEQVSLEDVYGDILRIAHALGVDQRGRELVARMRAETAGVAIDQSTSRPRVLVEWWPKPVIVPGRHSWVSDMIRNAGGANPWSDRDCKSTPLSDDEVVAAAPDAIVLSWCGIAPAKVRPDIVNRRLPWRATPAVANRRIFCVPEAWLGRPGPRLCEGLRALRTIVSGLDGGGAAASLRLA